MRSRILCAATLLVLLTGCAETGRGIDAACQAYRPIYIGGADALTDETAAQILTHNETGAKLCGWGGTHLDKG